MLKIHVCCSGAFPCVCIHTLVVYKLLLFCQFYIMIHKLFTALMACWGVLHGLLSIAGLFSPGSD